MTLPGWRPCPSRPHPPRSGRRRSGRARPPRTGRADALAARRGHARGARWWPARSWRARSWTGSRPRCRRPPCRPSSTFEPRRRLGRSVDQAPASRPRRRDTSRAGMTWATSPTSSVAGPSSASWPDPMAVSSRSASIGPRPTPSCGSRDDGIALDRDGQPSGVFGGGGAVPTTGALGGPGIVVLGWATSTEGRQRAIWSSAGRPRLVTDRGPGCRVGATSRSQRVRQGMIVWAPSGRAWVSEDGTTWRTTDIGRQGVTDVAVDEDGFVAVGRSGSLAFLATSSDGRSWGTPARPAPGPTTRSVSSAPDDGVEAVWIGDQRWRRSGSTWRAVQDATVPKGPRTSASIVGGATGLVARRYAHERGRLSRLDVGRHW